MCPAAMRLAGLRFGLPGSDSFGVRKWFRGMCSIYSGQWKILRCRWFLAPIIQYLGLLCGSPWSLVFWLLSLMLYPLVLSRSVMIVATLPPPMCLRLLQFPRGKYPAWWLRLHICCACKVAFLDLANCFLCLLRISLGKVVQLCKVVFVPVVVVIGWSRR